MVSDDTLTLPIVVSCLTCVVCVVATPCWACTPVAQTALSVLHPPWALKRYSHRSSQHDGGIPVSRMVAAPSLHYHAAYKPRRYVHVVSVGLGSHPPPRPSCRCGCSPTSTLSVMRRRGVPTAPRASLGLAFGPLSPEPPSDQRLHAASRCALRGRHHGGHIRQATRTVDSCRRWTEVGASRTTGGCSFGMARSLANPPVASDASLCSVSTLFGFSVRSPYFAHLLLISAYPFPPLLRPPAIALPLLNAEEWRDAPGWRAMRVHVCRVGCRPW